MVLLRGIHKRRAQHQYNSSKGKAGNTNRRRAQTIQNDAPKYFRCFITMKKNYSNPSTVIFSHGQRKNDKISPKQRFFLRDTRWQLESTSVI